MTPSDESDLIYADAAEYCSCCFYSRPDFGQCLMYCVNNPDQERRIVNSARIKGCRLFKMKSIIPHSDILKRIDDDVYRRSSQ